MMGVKLKGLFGLGALVFAAALTACGGPEQSTVGDSNIDSKSSAVNVDKEVLSFDNFTPALVSGSFGSLEFAGSQSSDGKNLQFWRNGKLAGQINYVTATGEFTVDVDFTTAEKDLVSGLVEALKGLDEGKVTATFGSEVGDTAMGLLFSAASYYSTAPTDKAYHKASKVKTDSAAQPMALAASSNWGDSGVSYLWQCKRTSTNKIATAYWTDYLGYRSVTDYCGTAAPACQGRCGPGCPCNSWYCYNRYYTKDCFDHDKCLDYNPGDATTSPTAPNCGDEWLDAADDFVVGSSSGW